MLLNIPFVLIENKQNFFEFAYDMSFEQANAYCSLNYGTILATFKTTNKLNNFETFLNDACPGNVCDSYI